LVLGLAQAYPRELIRLEAGISDAWIDHIMLPTSRWICKLQQVAGLKEMIVDDRVKEIW
jgi:hypothetical protein